jgi:tetratricopeptide (TPR) repeat protein
MDDPAGAISSYQSALRLQTSLAQAHNNLGVLHLKSGDHLAAIRDFERALQIDPASASARQNLELARRKFP